MLPRAPVERGLPESLKEDLLRPDAYAACAKTRTVDLVETHISWVFLLDHDVFKVKKPVDLGFLDFRDEGSRRAACEAEVRLNARLAPQVYQGVVPVRLGTDGRACVGGSGSTIDWAVHMVRLSDERRADHLLAAGELGPSAVAAIAKRIAVFHAAARSDAATAQFGTPEAIAVNLEENFAQTKQSIGRHLDSEEAAELVRWQRAFLRDHAALFARRAQAGRVRDGHGDLRLEHVYLESPGAVTVLDCIEFSDRLRFADVCSDIAFLSMDLAQHGRVDLAERLLAQYARESGDFDLYALVDFYESYRAYVRGKIAAMVAADPGVDERARRKADGEARRYFLLALSADRRSVLRPTLVAVGGLIGSGKSTIAERVASAIGSPVVDTDRTRKAMLGVEETRAMTEPAWQGAYDPAFTERVYAEALRRAAVVLASGRPVVVDASFRLPAMRQAARELAASHNVGFHFIECRATPAVCRARLVEREAHASVSDGRREIFDAFSEGFQPVMELPSSEHVIVDTTRPIQESEEVIRTSVEAWPKGLVG